MEWVQLIGQGAESEKFTVFASRTDSDGWWCHEHGELVTPPNWEFLKRGDAYVTRKVKELGPYWVVKRYSRSLKVNVTLGILAPRINIDKARRLAEETAQTRERVKESSRKQREKTNLKYSQEFRRYVIEYLNFDPRHRELADRIAEEATERATEVGSERVGRTSKLTMEEKARLAARATIRHGYTGYEETLEEAEEQIYGNIDDDTYRDLKRDANELVDEFIRKRRRAVGKKSR